MFQKYQYYCVVCLWRVLKYWHEKRLSVLWVLDIPALLSESELPHGKPRLILCWEVNNCERYNIATFTDRYRMSCSISKPVEASFSFWSISYRSWTFATFVSVRLPHWMLHFHEVLNVNTEPCRVRVNFSFWNVWQELPYYKLVFMVWFIHPPSQLNAYSFILFCHQRYIDL